jgi:Zn-dependent peptidase ImmA (M78 family)
METLDDIAGDIANDKNLQQLAVNSGIQSQAILNSLYQIDAIQKSRKQDLRDIQSGQVQRTLNRIATEDINRVFRDQFSEEARKRNLFFNPQGLIPETEMLPQETIDEFLKQRNPKTGKKFTLEDLYK